MYAKRALILLIFVAINSTFADSSRRLPYFAPFASSVFTTDASLRDVFFVSPTTGWAVGDRGTILATRDAGQTWTVQSNTEVRANLRTLSFVNEKIGFAAGTDIIPGTLVGVGVLLRTDDAGKTWQQVAAPVPLPLFSKLQMFTATQGWAVVAHTDEHPAGIVVTRNGGLTWQSFSLPVGQSPAEMPTCNWSLTGELLRDLRSGVVMGENGTGFTIRQGVLTANLSELQKVLGRRTIRAVRIPSKAPASGVGWLVGDGGLVLTTQNFGASWKSLPTTPPSISYHHDFRTVEMVGNSVYIAGAPGATILHSPDFGKTWNAVPTGVTTPINAIRFFDAKNGWATGDLGVVLRTTDGGKSWQRVRGKFKRLAVLGIYSDTTLVPLPAFARYAADDGYVSAIELVAREDVSLSDSFYGARPGQAGVSPYAVPLEWRLDKAAAVLGISSFTRGWQFPVAPQSFDANGKNFLHIWDSQFDQAVAGKSREVILARLVRSIRMWQPEVVTLRDVQLDGGKPMQSLISQLILTAVERAGDPTAYVELSKKLRLPFWRVPRVVATTSATTSKEMSFDVREPLPRLALSAEEFGSAAASYLFSNGASGNARETLSNKQGMLYFRKLGGGEVAGTFQGGASDPLFGVVSTHLVQDARRDFPRNPEAFLATLAKQSRRRGQTFRLLEYSRQAVGSRYLLGLIAQAHDLTLGLAPQRSAELLEQLATRLIANGQEELAAEIRQIVLTHYPATLCGGEVVLRELVRLQSAEVKYQQRDVPENPQNKRVTPKLLLETLRKFHLGLLMRPEVCFPVRKENPGYVESLGIRAVSATWQRAALSEKWLRTTTNPQARPPLPTVLCPVVTSKPHLDGKFDDAIWTSHPAKPFVLRSLVMGNDNKPEGQTTVQFARDANFLYIAARCPRVGGVPYAAATEKSERDAKKLAPDFLRFFLDVDRDRFSGYTLEVDYSRKTRDVCAGDKTWNPRWFFATNLDKTHWTLEAAVPLAELVPQVKQGEVWSLGVQRVVATKNIWSLCEPIGANVSPDNLGWLRFSTPANAETNDKGTDEE